MEHLQGWWYIDTRWHHYRHCQMPNLTLPCWRAHRDDRIGHLVTQFRVRTQKLCKSQVSDSGCAEAAGRPASPRLAGPTPFPSTSFLATRPLGTLQWTPYALDIQANTKDMTGRLPPWIERPQLEANSINFSETKCGWFVMTIHHTMKFDWIDLVEIPGRPASTL